MGLFSPVGVPEWNDRELLPEGLGLRDGLRGGLSGDLGGRGEASSWELLEE